MHNAEHFVDWIDNDAQSLANKIERGYFNLVDEEPADWNFSDEHNRFTGFLNYLDYIWKFKFYFCGIIYDKYDDEEYDIPAENATLAAFNLHLRSSDDFENAPFYAILVRSTRKKTKKDWFLKCIIQLSGNTDEEKALKLAEDHTPGPDRIIESTLPTDIVFSDFNITHFYERLSRFPEYVRGRVSCKEELGKTVLTSIFGSYSKGSDGVYRFCENDKRKSTVADFEPNYLIEKWFAEAPKGNDPKRLLNPNTNSFLYPICIDEELTPEASLVFERIQQAGLFANFTGNTIYSLRYAYRNALLVRGLNGMEDTWLTKNSVEKAIQKGCK